MFPAAGLLDASRNGVVYVAVNYRVSVLNSVQGVATGIR